MDGEVPLSPSLVSLVPVPPGFAPIGPPGSLSEPPVAADSLPQDFAPPGSPVSLFSSGPLLLSWVQPTLDEACEVRRLLLPNLPSVRPRSFSLAWEIVVAGIECRVSRDSRFVIPIGAYVLVLIAGYLETAGL